MTYHSGTVTLLDVSIKRCHQKMATGNSVHAISKFVKRYFTTNTKKKKLVKRSANDTFGVVAHGEHFFYFNLPFYVENIFCLTI